VLQPLHHPPTIRPWRSAQEEPLPEDAQKINHKRLAAVYPPAGHPALQNAGMDQPDPFFFKAVFCSSIWGYGGLAALCDVVNCRFHAFVFTRQSLSDRLISGEGQFWMCWQVFLLCLECSCWFKGFTAGGYLCIGFAVMAKYLSAAVIPSAGGAMRGGSPGALLARALFIPYLAAGPALFRSCSNSQPGCTTDDFLTGSVGIDYRARVACSGPPLLPFAWMDLAHRRMTCYARLFRHRQPAGVSA